MGAVPWPRAMSLARAVALTLLLGSLFGAQGKLASGLPEGLPVVEFSHGQSIYNLPGYEMLMPSQPRGAVNITLTPATVQGPSGESLMLRFANGLYRDDDRGTMHMFGPTLRVRAGDTYTIRLTNNLTASGPSSHRHNGFRDLQDTNLHTHGLHDAPGVRSQATATEYTGGDNIFNNLPAKPTPDAEPASLLFGGAVPKNHLPGLHWYHPHKHGSTALQTFTASGLILVEDDLRWLPDESGCAAVRSLLAQAPDLLLHLELLTFSPAAPIYVQNLGQYYADLEDPSPAVISELATPQNNLCCNGTGQTKAAVQSLPVLGSANASDVIFVNGGYQPVIPLESGQYQRWRLVNTGFRRILDLQILDSDTSSPAKQCELLLLAKDGVYLMEIPRQVGHIFLTNGNRAELLVKCTAPAGKRYVLAAGTGPSPFGANFTNGAAADDSLVQPIVATIEVQAAQRPEQPTPNLTGCTPLRPDYAPDLRDKALQAHNATGLLVNQNVSFDLSQGFGCLVNGQNFSLPDPNPVELPLGKVVHWDFQNALFHPLHLHVNPFQIAKLYEDELEPGLQYSSWFEMPVLSPLGNTAVGLRIQPGPYAGYAVLHCHRLAHEDLGCMKVVKFTCPGYDEKQPEECTGFRFPVPGTLS